MSLVSRGIVVTLVLAGMLIAAACTPAAAPTSSVAPAQSSSAAASSAKPSTSAGPSTSAKPAASADWKTEWDKVVAAAKKEGKVAVAAPPGELWRSAIMEFEKAYPEIKVQLLGGGIPDLAPKITAERNAGQYLWDVLINSIGGTTLTLMKAGHFAPLRPTMILPEVVDDSKWSGGIDNGFSDLSKTYLYQFGGIAEKIVFVNRDGVAKTEFRGIDDLVDPKWKGKIATRDLRRTAGSGTNAAALLLDRKGEEWFRRFMAQNLVIIQDERPLVEALVRGAQPIIVGPPGTAVDTFAKEGALGNVEYLGGPDDPDTVYDSSNRAGVGVFSNPPNSNAQKVFINWLLSQKTQESMSTAVLYASRRLDAPPPPMVVEQGQAPKPGVTYTRMDAEKNVPLLAKVSEIAKEYIK